MNNKKKRTLINILVICLYFMWPYFLNSITNLFNLAEIPYLYTSFGVNFIFLFIVIYIYRNKLNDYYENFKKKFKINILKSLKIFGIGLVSFVVINALLYNFGVLAPDNTVSMVNIFKKIPLMFILNTLFYYPVIEEIVFKMTFKDIIKNKWTFIIITGLLNATFQIIFSMNHFTDLLYILSYSIFFGSLSYVYYKTDNIIYPIIFRVCYNLIPCIGYIISLVTNSSIL